MSTQTSPGLHVRAGEAATDGCALLVTPESAGWTYSGLAVLHLVAGCWCTGEKCVAELTDTDLVIVSEFLGHARLETTRVYTRSTAEDRAKALDLLPIDR